MGREFFVDFSRGADIFEQFATQHNMSRKEAAMQYPELYYAFSEVNNAHVRRDIKIKRLARVFNRYGFRLRVRNSTHGVRRSNGVL